MKTVIFLNRWNDLNHLMLANVGDDGEGSRPDSRYATSLEQARNAVAYRQTEFDVTADVHDHSMPDVDLDDQLDGSPW